MGIILSKLQYQQEFMNKKINRQKGGNALLIAILIMAVLLVFGLGINRLIVKELRVEAALIDGGQAYYSAEGASELAMYDIETNLAGYEVSDESGDVVSEASYKYDIVARGENWPCDMYGGQVIENDVGDLWRVLAPEESVMVPLFVDMDGIKEFKIEYYTDTPGMYENLRWKIMGISSEGYSLGLTEAISNYEEDLSSGSFDEESGHGFYYEDLGGSWGGRMYAMNESESVKNFIDSHDYNYLILTNIYSGEDGLDENLYVRLSEADREFVCEYTKVEADGLMGDYIQQIDAYIKQGEPLPVFDFVLWEKDL